MSINVNEVSSKYNFNIESASYVGHPVDNTVMFVTKKVEILIDNLNQAKNCLIFTEDMVDIPEQLQKNNCFIKTSNPQGEYANFVYKLFAQREAQDTIRKYKLTEEGYYIGENVTIGSNVIIEPFCFIGHDVIIGDNARIHSGARLKNIKVGDNFIAGENCTIGTYGFIMALDENGKHIRIPTLGKVIIGDNVEIGALSNVSCGSGGDTIIEDYVKIDSFVHIGHDAHLCKNVEITAGVIVGGFDELGVNSYIGINATLRNRIKIGQNTIVGMGAVVTKSIDDNITVIGNPAKPFEKKV